jgi:uncharacterized membrane protein YtjA (UPF0391 family)
MGAPGSVMATDVATGNPIQQEPNRPTWMAQPITASPPVLCWNRRCCLKLNQMVTAALGAAAIAEQAMTILRWALLFFVISIVAGVLGFTGISAASADIARFLFYVFVVIFLVLLILGLTLFRV